MDYNSILLDMMSWARQAGAIQLSFFRGNSLGISTKQNEADIVTNADRASEQFLMEQIRAHYPGHAILSEESGESGQSDWRWVIDPLDGTTNFSQGLPSWAVSIGLEHKGKAVAGVVYAPYLDEMFSAALGEGARLNGQPISVSGKTSLAQAVVATGFPYDRADTDDNNLQPFSRLFTRVRGIRTLGAASVDLCYCAAGILDAYWEINLHVWDVSAGLLILAEAGGAATRYRADRNVSVVAGTPAIQQQVLEIVASS